MTSWMREEPAGPSTEDYLLGKAVDKNFDIQGTMGQINAVEYDCTPESIFSSRAEHQVDLQRKLQEDPLISIKKQELDTRKRVLDNPLKMREIEKHIKRSKKQKKEKKKKKKKHRQSSQSEDSDNDQALNMLLLKKLENFDPSKNLPPRKTEDDDDDDRKAKTKARSYNQSSRRDRSRSRDRRKSRERRRSRSRERRRSRSRERRRSKSPDRKWSRDRKRSRSRERRAPLNLKDKEKSYKDNKGDEDSRQKEKERKLKEMIENAKWRDERREKNVKRYKALDEKEEEESRLDHNPDFIRKQLASAASSSSVEKRIQSNKYNIQRGTHSMDTNFARR